MLAAVDDLADVLSFVGAPSQRRSDAVVGKGQRR
jgi:hypothetical protein